MTNPAGRLPPTVLAAGAVLALLISGCSKDDSPQETMGNTTLNSERYAAGSAGVTYGKPGDSSFSIDGNEVDVEWTAFCYVVDDGILMGMKSVGGNASYDEFLLGGSVGSNKTLGSVTTLGLKYDGPDLSTSFYETDPSPDGSATLSTEGNRFTITGEGKNRAPESDGRSVKYEIMFDCRDYLTS
jgi:ipoprotein LpqH